MSSKLNMAVSIRSWRMRCPVSIIVVLVFFLSPALPAKPTFLSRSNLLMNSLSTRGVNTGQHDGPHRAGRTGFWTTQGRLTADITNSTTWNYLTAAIADADGSADAGGANGGFSGWPGMDTRQNSYAQCRNGNFESSKIVPIRTVYCPPQARQRRR